MIVKVSPVAQKKLKTLVEAGVFADRAAAAAFLIQAGLSKQGELLESVRAKLSQIDAINQEMLDCIERKTSEIKQLQADLRGLVKQRT